MTGYVTEIQIQRIQELGLQNPVTERSFYIFNEYIREDEGPYCNFYIAFKKQLYNLLSNA